MRTEIIERTLYKFDELEPHAKENAREWWRSCENGDFYTESVYSDASKMGKLIGIDLDSRPVKLMGGGIRMEPCIYYSGFWSQGDGACFEGSYQYQKGALKAIKAECNDDELIRIAQALQALQRRYFYKLCANTVHSGHYYHSGCMKVDVQYCDDKYRDIEDAADELTQLLRDFADWIYDQLEKDYEYRMSDENVDESILANGYEFTEEGRIA